MNKKLIPQFLKLKPGARIVAHEFAIRGVKLDKVVRFDSKETGLEHSIDLWTAPLKKPKK